MPKSPEALAARASGHSRIFVAFGIHAVLHAVDRVPVPRRGTVAAEGVGPRRAATKAVAGVVAATPAI